MISVEEHLSRILGSVRRLAPIGLALPDAQGCVLAEDVASEVDLPGFTNSAMDGYAVRAAEVATASAQTPVILPVAGDIAAGNTEALSLAPGQSMRIMTGAPVPRGADAVVPVERTDGGLARVAVHAAVHPGQHVRDRGVDVRAGDALLHDGVRLGPRQLALLAAAGLARVQVTPKPRVVVLSTGDELVEPGQRPGFGQVVDSNGLMIAAAVREMDAVPFRVGGVPDDARVLRDTLDSQLLRADAVVTTGGVSAGAYDTVKEVLSHYATMRFDKVAMQPGMPQGFGVLGDLPVPVFTLPGNPVSALVSFEVFVAPALRLMAGRPLTEHPLVDAVAEHDWPAPAGKLQFARVVLTRSARGATVRLAGGQGSHILGGLAEANALAMVPAEVTAVTSGTTLQCRLLPPIMEP